MNNRTQISNQSLLLARCLFLAVTLATACGTQQTRAVVQTSADIAVGSATKLALDTALSLGLLRVDPTWAPLRNDPRFRRLAGIEEK